jgi:hypothetical protein
VHVCATSWSAGCAEHVPAQRAIERAAEDPDGWCIPLPCRFEFWSVVTHPSSVAGASSPALAARFVRELVGAARSLLTRGVRCVRRQGAGGEPWASARSGWSMKNLSVLLVSLLFLGGCVTLRWGSGMGIDADELSADSQLERSVREMAILLTVEAAFPQDFTERLHRGEKPGDFDPNRFFTALRHLRMEPGSVLDYGYVCDRGASGEIYAGKPQLFAAKAIPRSTGNPSTIRSSPAPDADVFQHVQTDGTAEGFVELAILRIMGNEFYVFWHAIPGSDVVPVCGEKTLRNLLTPLGVGWVRMHGLRAQPVIDMNQESVTVSLLTFSDWQGVSRRTFVFRRDVPHTLLGESRRCILFHDRYVGVRF